MWIAGYDSFDEFKRAVSAEPALVAVTGRLEGRQQTISLMTAVQEAEQVWIRGRTGWVAAANRKGRTVTVTKLSRSLQHR